MKLLLYCTKSKPYLYREDDDTFKLENKQLNEDISEYKKYYGLNNGKIVAECDFEVEEIKCEEKYGVYYTNNINAYDLINKSYLSAEQLDEYLKGKNGYAIHIKNLHIFKKSRELFNYIGKTKHNLLYYIEKAPQNMMYCYMLNGKNDKYILISIRPEWLCKILNGEKTIEVRKKILKEMIKNE